METTTPKRRLPIVQNNAPRGPSHGDGDGGGGGDGAGGEASDPPAWHWVPIGVVVSLVVGAVLARSFWVPLAQRQSDAVYGRHATPAEYARAAARVPQAAIDAMHLKVALAGAGVALAAVIVGGFVVGRFGARTNQRHGTLAGLFTMAALVLFSGTRVGLSGFLTYLLLIPFGGLAGWLGGLAGTRMKLRSAE